MIKDEYEKLVALLKRENNFLITSHLNPDGDAIGSQLALAFLLKKMKKKFVILNSDKIPPKYKFLPHSNLIQTQIINHDYKTVLILDCGDLKRTGKMIKICKKAKIRVNIDHHITNTQFGEINLACDKVSATAEKIYHLIKKLKYEINKEMALCLYTAILTDTASFKYNSTSSDTHRIISELMRVNINPKNIYEEVYESRTLGELKLLGKALSSLKMCQNNKIAMIVLSEEQKKVKDEGFIEYAASIKGVEVAIFFKKISHEKIKVAFRSNENVDVAKVASLFHGGGHTNASGCVIFGTLENAIKKIIPVVKKEISNLSVRV